MTDARKDDDPFFISLARGSSSCLDLYYYSDRFDSAQALRPGRCGVGGVIPVERGLFRYHGAGRLIDCEGCQEDGCQANVVSWVRDEKHGLQVGNCSSGIVSLCCLSEAVG